MPLRLLFCLFALLLSASGAEPTLNFGVVPTESSANLRKDYEPIRVALEQALGRPVAMFFAPDYTSIIEAMRFHKIDLGNIGNNAAIDAVDLARGEVFAQVVDKDGHAGYWSLIVVHRDSPISTLEELIAHRHELTFAMGDHQSTSGTLVPGYYAFTQNGVLHPAKEFKAFRNANHEANVLAVANRQIDAATCNNEAIFRLEQYHPEMAKQLKPIWKGPLIAGDPMLMRADLPADLKQKISAFFLHYGDTPEGRTALAPLKWSGFRASSNTQLNPYRLLRVLRDIAKVEADERLSAPEKAEKLAALHARRAALENSLAAVPAS
jgi:phosphonate transport system substrate-binding protein